MKFNKIILALIIAVFAMNIAIFAQQDTKITKQLEPKIEKQVLDEVNSYRSSKGLKHLVWNDVVAEGARSHSANMADGQPVKHQGFKERMKKIEEQLPYRASTENVGKVSGAKPAEEVVKFWMDDVGSAHNMLEDYNTAGIGVYKTSTGDYYITLIMIRI